MLQNCGVFHRGRRSNHLPANLVHCWLPKGSHPFNINSQTLVQPFTTMPEMCILHIFLHPAGAGVWRQCHAPHPPSRPHPCPLPHRMLPRAAGTAGAAAPAGGGTCCQPGPGGRSASAAEESGGAGGAASAGAAGQAHCGGGPRVCAGALGESWHGELLAVLWGNAAGVGVGVVRGGARRCTVGSWHRRIGRQLPDVQNWGRIGEVHRGKQLQALQGCGWVALLLLLLIAATATAAGQK